MAFNIESIPNQANKPAILLRQSWREGSRIRKKTIANLSKLPAKVINDFRTILKGGIAVSDGSQLLKINRSLHHGHVIAVLATARRLGLERLLHRQLSRQRQLAFAAIISRVLAPDSKLTTARQLSPETANTSLGALLELETVTDNELRDMLDWLLTRQPWIERSLAKKHLQDKTLIRHDVTSSHREGKSGPLAAFGYLHDGQKGEKQISFSLLCTPEGCPIAVELFTGNTANPSTVASQVEKLRKRFRINRIALIDDRGMMTTAQIREHWDPAGIAWISALKSTDLRKLAPPPRNPNAEPTQPPLVPDAVAELTSPDFPGERLTVGLNPRLREERQRKRKELLQLTEQILERIAASVRAGTLSGKVKIGHRVGREVNRLKVEKHFQITITDHRMSWSRRHDRIEAEARFDGVYVIRTSLSDIKSEAAIEAYQSLSQVERAFRSIKKDLRARPFDVSSEAHVFLCLLSYYIEWHMRQRLAPLLFEDDDREAARGAGRTTPVESAKVSPDAQQRADSKLTQDDFPVHRFRTLLDDLSSVGLNSVSLSNQVPSELMIVTTPTKLQDKAFQLLGINPSQTVPLMMTG